MENADDEKNTNQILPVEISIEHHGLESSLMTGELASCSDDRIYDAVFFGPVLQPCVTSLTGAKEGYGKRKHEGGKKCALETLLLNWVAPHT